VKRTRLPLALVVPLVSFAAVIALALGIGMLLLEINNQIGEQESIIAALAMTILIMGAAVLLSRE
jgi:hypothetical protein